MFGAKGQPARAPDFLRLAHSQPYNIMAFRQLRTSLLSAGSKPFAARVLTQPGAVSLWHRHLSSEARSKIDNVRANYVCHAYIVF